MTQRRLLPNIPEGRSSEERSSNRRTHTRTTDPFSDNPHLGKKLRTFLTAIRSERNSGKNIPPQLAAFIQRAISEELRSGNSNINHNFKF
jgi:hypothetical protein